MLQFLHLVWILTLDQIWPLFRNLYNDNNSHKYTFSGQSAANLFMPSGHSILQVRLRIYTNGRCHSLLPPEVTTHKSQENGHNYPPKILIFSPQICHFTILEHSNKKYADDQGLFRYYVIIYVGSKMEFRDRRLP